MNTPTDIVLIGYGEVGRAIAKRLQSASLTCVDPAHAGRDGVVPTLPDRLDGALVLGVIPSSAAADVARQVAGRGAALYVDMSSSSQALMRQISEDFADGTAFVDGAIMGSVDLTGADTPIILSGPDAHRAADWIAALGLNATALENSEPGDACGLKLLRSLMTKGMEALAIECFGAAERMGLGPQIRDNLMDVNARPFPDLLDAMVRTHVLHAPRRRHEVEAALEQARDLGLPMPVTGAVLAAFERSAERIETERPAPPSTTRDALLWLRGSLS